MMTWCTASPASYIYHLLLLQQQHYYHHHHHYGRQHQNHHNQFAVHIIMMSCFGENLEFFFVKNLLKCKISSSYIKKWLRYCSKLFLRLFQYIFMLLYCLNSQAASAEFWQLVHKMMKLVEGYPRFLGENNAQKKNLYFFRRGGTLLYFSNFYLWKPSKMTFLTKKNSRQSLVMRKVWFHSFKKSIFWRFFF